MGKSIISIDLGGTKCAGAVISEKGNIIAQDKENISGLSGDQVGELICSLSHDVLHQTGIDISKIYGIGISVPGISYKEKGTVWAPNIPGWGNYSLKEKIEQSFDKKIPVAIDSDRACSILGEAWLGAAHGCRNAIHLAFGTGIGAGIMVDGRILRGQNDIAGAIGWLALDDRYPDGYKQFGCFEYNASGDGLSRLTSDVFHADNIYSKTSLNPHLVSAEEIFQAYEEKDILARAVIEKAVVYWGKGVANLVSIFNPEKIIFGGGLFGPGLKFLDQIYIEAKKYAQPVAINLVELCGGKLGTDAQLFGAVRMMMDEFL